MLEFRVYYNNFGVRQKEHVVRPRVVTMAKLQIPLDSLVHYQGAGGKDLGPPSKDVFIQKSNESIPVYHITDLTERAGNPRLSTINLPSEIRDYHNQHRRFRRVQDLQLPLRSRTAPLYLNYALLHTRFRYNINIYSTYNAWRNRFVTMVDTMVDAAKTHKRHQFLQVELPKMLPSLGNLRQMLNGPTQSTLHFFNDPQVCFMFELWKWAGEHRTHSVFSKIPHDLLDRINFIFTESGHWTVYNMGIIDSMIKKDGTSTATESMDGDVWTDQGLLKSYVAESVMPEIITSEMLDQMSMESDVVQLFPIRSTVSARQMGMMTLIFYNTLMKLRIGEIGEHDEIEVVADDGTVTTVKNPKLQEVDDLFKSGEELDEALNKELEEISAAVNNIQQERERQEAADRRVELISHEAPDPDEEFDKHLDRLAEQSALTVVEYSRLRKISKAYQNIHVQDKPIHEFAKVEAHEKELPNVQVVEDRPTILDKNMLHNKVGHFDRTYVQKVMPKHIASVGLGFRKAGIALTGYETEVVHGPRGSHVEHVFTIHPAYGQPSTIVHKLPLLNEDGSYVINGTHYRLRKQRTDLPFRKITPSRVALNTYYGKIFVARSEKRVNDYYAWLLSNVVSIALNRERSEISNFMVGDVFDNHLNAPRLYSALSTKFISFEFMGFKWMFDRKEVERVVPAEDLKVYEVGGSVVAGIDPKKPGKYLVLDTHGNCYSAENDQLTPIPGVEKTLGLEVSSAPIDFCELKYMGQNVPVGMVLSYLVGYDTLVNSLNLKPRIINAGERLNLEENEYAIYFSDETHIFTKDDVYATLIMAGFRSYFKGTRQFPRHEFNKPGVYLNVFETQGLGIHYVREIDHMNNMFVDPISEEVLREMKLPTDFRSLVAKAVSVLVTDQHPDELDTKHQRIRGNERMVGAMYLQMVKAIKVHSALPNRKNSKIQVNPFATWKAITTDPAVSMIMETNPIQDLKEIDMVTHAGVGGRMAEAMTKNTRAYHKNDMGVISEATTDSGDVGINTAMSASPNLNNIYGMVGDFDHDNPNIPSLISTAAMVSPGCLFDDGKRTLFISVQNTHRLACVGYHQPYLRTGYESVVPYRTTELFSYAAKEPGTVVSVTPTAVLLKYDSGEERGIEIGRRYGSAAGLTIPHSIQANVVAGQRVAPGDIIVYNTDYFEQDQLDPKHIILKNYMLVKTVLMETPDTLEDSCAISSRLAEKLVTKVSNRRSIVVDFRQRIHQSVKTGQTVDSDDYLCLIEDAVTTANNLFDEESKETLKNIGSTNAPRVKCKGVVEEIRVYYNGEKDDMDESLRALAEYSDREIARHARAMGRRGGSGQVTDQDKFEGEVLEPNTMMVVYTITADEPAGVGDKGGFCNQLKTTYGRVEEFEMRTESGELIDAIFGGKSVANRIVRSPYIQGTTNVLLDLIKKKALEAFLQHSS